MTWHTATVPASGLATLLAKIRSAGGTIACSLPGVDGIRVTWTTVSSDSSE
ncbi:hypothetical protein [Nocardioides humilatus]|uniref:hypothetical protein n=1 Tax=Nocardioides humilatus TaxID=2607660 RepID=UPI00165F268A|nr:hypothetical protein [Nocardioides humilatus]